MSEKQITRRTGQFYEQFNFPGSRPVDRDGLVFLRRFDCSVKRISGRKKNIRVLDAGCGTGNTIISLANRYRDIEFLGLDNSAASLAQAVREAEKYSLTNLKFNKRDLSDPLQTAHKFDIIVCLGVLHHTANMEKVLSNLNNVLNKGGEMYLWIYGKHGRYNHSLNMRLLRMLLGTKPRPENLTDFAGRFATEVQQGMPMADLIGKMKVNETQLKAYRSPVWIADQFLNPHEVLIDMEELLELVKKTGFRITHLPGMEENAAAKFDSPEFSKRYESLSKVKQLIAADLLLKPERYFVLLSKTGAGRRRR